MLMDEVRRAARSEDAVEMRLYGNGDNSRAIRAYDTQGFRASSYRMMTLGL